jgi:hypothetical protein
MALSRGRYAVVGDYAVTDLTANDGMPEINAMLEKLPWKVVEGRAERRARHLR